MAAILRDEQVKPIERAVWHIEHVLRFPDARHFHYHGKDISLLEYWGTALFIPVTPVFVCLLIYYIFTKILLYFKNHINFQKCRKVE